MEKIDDIINRYQEENSNIFQYILNIIFSFERKRNVVVDGVTDSDSVMEKLARLTINMDSSNGEEESQQIIEDIKNLIVTEREKTNIYLDENDRKIVPHELQNLEISNEEWGLVEYLSHNYDDMTFDGYMQYLNNIEATSLKEEIDDLPDSEQFYSEFTVNDYELLLQYVRIYQYNEHLEELENHVEELKEMLNSYHLMDYKHSINIFRQSFVLLLTTFDATVFDIVEIIIRENFFDFVKANDEINENYKLKDIVQSGSFESFQENIIKNILQSNYASGLLRMLYKYDKNYFVIGDEDYYEIICEIIARRNLHIHKRGIVDQGYFEQAKGNPYKLKCGEIAYIRGSYYLEVMAALFGLLNNIQEVFNESNG